MYTQGKTWDWNPALCPAAPSASSWSDSANVYCMPGPSLPLEVSWEEAGGHRCRGLEEEQRLSSPEGIR